MKSARNSTRQQPAIGAGAIHKLQLPPAVLIFQELRRIERTQGLAPFGCRHPGDESPTTCRPGQRLAA